LDKAAVEQHCQKIGRFARLSVHADGVVHLIPAASQACARRGCDVFLILDDATRTLVQMATNKDEAELEAHYNQMKREQLYMRFDTSSCSCCKVYELDDKTRLTFIPLTCSKLTGSGDALCSEGDAMYPLICCKGVMLFRPPSVNPAAFINPISTLHALAAVNAVLKAIRSEPSAPESAAAEAAARVQGRITPTLPVDLVHTNLATIFPKMGNNVTALAGRRASVWTELEVELAKFGECVILLRLVPDAGRRALQRVSKGDDKIPVPSVVSRMLLNRPRVSMVLPTLMNPTTGGIVDLQWAQHCCNKRSDPSSDVEMDVLEVCPETRCVRLLPFIAARLLDVDDAGRFKFKGLLQLVVDLWPQRLAELLSQRKAQPTGAAFKNEGAREGARACARGTSDEPAAVRANCADGTSDVHAAGGETSASARAQLLIELIPVAQQTVRLGRGAPAAIAAALAMSAGQAGYATCDVDALHKWVTGVLNADEQTTAAAAAADAAALAADGADTEADAGEPFIEAVASGTPADAANAPAAAANADVSGDATNAPAAAASVGARTNADAFGVGNANASEIEIRFKQQDLCIAMLQQEMEGLKFLLELAGTTTSCSDPGLLLMPKSLGLTAQLLVQEFGAAHEGTLTGYDGSTHTEPLKRGSLSEWPTARLSPMGAHRSPRLPCARAPEPDAAFRARARVGCSACVCSSQELTCSRLPPANWPSWDTSTTSRT